jgi:predicted lipoprotein with Yx(FWY)xxD motif
MNKSMWIIGLVVVVIVVLGIGGYYIMRHPQLLSMQPAPAPTAEVITSTPTTSAPANNIYMIKTDATKGAYLTDFAGMTLYTYSKDTVGVSNCTGTCAVNWPPYTSGATAQKTLPTDVTAITRTDDSKQFAWKGMPLYYFKSDTKAGDITGDGVGGFTLAK